jgi:hypothetical protein
VFTVIVIIQIQLINAFDIQNIFSFAIIIRESYIFRALIDNINLPCFYDNNLINRIHLTQTLNNKCYLLEIDIFLNCNKTVTKV